MNSTRYNPFHLNIDGKNSLPGCSILSIGNVSPKLVDTLRNQNGGYFLIVVIPHIMNEQFLHYISRLGFKL